MKIFFLFLILVKASLSFGQKVEVFNISDSKMIRLEESSRYKVISHAIEDKNIIPFSFDSLIKKGVEFSIYFNTPTTEIKYLEILQLQKSSKNRLIFYVEKSTKRKVEYCSNKINYSPADLNRHYLLLKGDNYSPTLITIEF